MQLQAPKVAIAAILLLAVTSFFVVILRLDINTDIQEHTQAVQNIVLGDSVIPSTFLFYVLTMLFSGFSKELETIQLAGAFVLGLAVAAKFWVTVKFLSETEGTPDQETSSLPLLFGLGLMLVFALPAGGFYIGVYPPNVWHNSTTIVLMPFSLLLFWQSAEQLRAPETSRLIVLSVLAVLNAVAKPSFLLAFLPAYTLFLVWRFRLSPLFFTNCIPVVVGVLSVIALTLRIFGVSADQGSAEVSGIAIRSMGEIISSLSNVPKALALSLTFPFLLILCYPRKAIKDVYLGFSLGLLLFAVLVSRVFFETGSRMFHGNFSWGIYICNYLVFCASTRLFIIVGKDLGFDSPKNRLLSLMFIVHVLAGINYPVMMFMAGTFWT